MNSQSIQTLSAILVVSYILYVLLAPLLSPLRRVPGPFYARFTNLFYLNRIRHGGFQYENVALHRKFGPLVRLGPKLISVDDPSALKTIYGVGSKFPKGDWYSAWKVPGPSNFTLFADRDMARHADTRKRFQYLYSMTSLVSYETFVDECADIFATRLQEIADAGIPVDMAHWFQCYAFDVIACITYGNRFGFLDDGHDIQGLIARLQLFGARGRVTLMDFVGKRMAIRQEERKARGVEGKAKAQAEGAPRHFLDRLLDQHQEDPEKMTMYHVFLMGNSNINAGSDTTATSLSGILYYLLRYPRVLGRLREEIREFSSKGQLSAQPTFKETQQMPYLDAVIKESLRLHSAVGLPLWRTVPEGGTTVSGQYLPQGTNVGVNAWVAAGKVV
ncbi:hypothetical protein VMCG_04219 [Cytospora schulzeri]|uniref:Cytochrome P450 n=1 Tax=Cytospora schulzeri TaxID=448051 RepID=A0A423WTH7_9PEZI|nr:hypothetical protein VMCG_04219 [Valsa malicola]